MYTQIKVEIMQYITKNFTTETYCVIVSKIIYIRFSDKEEHIAYENIKKKRALIWSLCFSANHILPVTSLKLLNNP